MLGDHIDEMSWASPWASKFRRSEGFFGLAQEKRVREDRGGKIFTLLAATSCAGLELFMLLEGSVDTPTWCYFINELQK